uniref:Branched-chain amino acid transport system permease protein n=1 Tax=Candidatus Kentrum eta TaxID=2126337 RepID=A0A450VQ64_9GAMM|nr:MAG: branched-chain amino acid transport system permease protein [Candidatus Kentron sp. H]VFK03924.1 MAG: branched-chain amino acid transport system permease protein [Candidatus Kentron sp. H]VFK06920.1 MAG: branched-chain amino acid transport system permease protein [Candidatus Kentron sp. H]
MVSMVQRRDKKRIETLSLLDKLTAIFPILHEAAFSAGLALILSLPFFGFYTEEQAGSLVVQTRFSWVAFAVAVVFFGRLLFLSAVRLRSAEGWLPAPPGFVTGITTAFRPHAHWFLIAALFFVFLLPALPFSNRYTIDLTTTVLIYVMLGWGLNIVVGLAGLLDLGYVAFYAMGAYSYALLAITFDLSFWICLPLAGLMAAILGVLLGFPVLRLRGDYLAIVTLGFGEMIRIILLNWYELTGGPDGISGIPRPSFFGLPFTRNPEEGVTAFHQFFGWQYAGVQRVIFLYYLILILALLTNYFTIRIRKLPVGRAWEALREDEIACRSLGINPTNTKLTAFGIGAMFGGFAGAFFATRQGFISPESFTFMESATIVAIVVLGGMGSQIGVVIAAIVLVLLPELGREFVEFRMLLFGVAMVLIMTWQPRGLLSHREPTIRLSMSFHGLGGRKKIFRP